MTDTEVLIVGAGPTGLVLALWLARRGIRARIIDKAAEPGMTSRALVVHARTLELYRQAGLADAVVEQGLRFDVINLWVRRTPVGRAVLGDMGEGLSSFPYLVIYPQDQHERLLIERLRQAGVSVERGSSSSASTRCRARCGFVSATRTEGKRAATARTWPDAMAPGPRCARGWAPASPAVPTSTSSMSPTSNPPGH